MAMARLSIKATPSNVHLAQREILQRLTEIRLQAIKGEINLLSVEVEYEEIRQEPWKVRSKK